MPENLWKVSEEVAGCRNMGSGSKCIGWGCGEMISSGTMMTEKLLLFLSPLPCRFKNAVLTHCERAVLIVDLNDAHTM